MSMKKTTVVSTSTLAGGRVVSRRDSILPPVPREHGINTCQPKWPRESRLVLAVRDFQPCSAILSGMIFEKVSISLQVHHVSKVKDGIKRDPGTQCFWVGVIIPGTFARHVVRAQLSIAYSSLISGKISCTLIPSREACHACMHSAKPQPFASQISFRAEVLPHISAPSLREPCTPNFHSREPLALTRFF